MLPDLHTAPPDGATTDLDALLLACHRQKEDAQRQLYDKFYALAFSVALHYSATRAEAEELVHDAFLKLFRTLAERPFAGNFVSYFRSIIVNTGIDHYRVQQRRKGLLRRFLPTARATQNDALHNLGEQDVLRYIQRLTPGYRLVFNLYVLEGLSHPEIARRLGISVSTSKSNLAKARRVLQASAPSYFASETNADHV